MNRTRTLLPTLQSPSRRQLPSLSSFTTHTQSTQKFILKNLQEHRPLFEDCPTQPDEEEGTTQLYQKAKQSRHKQFNTYATLGYLGRNEQLLSQAKLINNKYFQMGHRLSMQKENTPAPPSLKRYRSFRNKWFNDKQEQ